MDFFKFGQLRFNVGRIFRQGDHVPDLIAAARSQIFDFGIVRLQNLVFLLVGQVEVGLQFRA
ncbi:hypothetical protein D1872_327810 [compost metagenome]